MSLRPVDAKPTSGFQTLLRPRILAMIFIVGLHNSFDSFFIRVRSRIRLSAHERSLRIEFGGDSQSNLGIDFFVAFQNPRGFMFQPGSTTSSGLICQLTRSLWKCASLLDETLGNRLEKHPVLTYFQISKLLE